MVLVLVAAYLYFSNSSANMDIETVKNSSIPSSPLASAFLAGLATDQAATIGSGISKIAGVDGIVKWEAYRPTDKYKDNPNIVCVQAIINKTTDKGEKQTALFQFLLNKSTQYIELSYFDVNGLPKNMLEATMALQYGIL